MRDPADWTSNQRLAKEAFKVASDLEITPNHQTSVIGRWLQSQGVRTRGFFRQARIADSPSLPIDLLEVEGLWIGREEHCVDLAHALRRRGLGVDSINHGRYFDPSDPEWLGADDEEELEEDVVRLRVEMTARALEIGTPSPLPATHRPRI